MSTILLVEDTPANRALATKLLTAAGHEVLTAPDAAAGIALALDRQPDLVLMDLGKPIEFATFADSVGALMR